MRLVVELLRRPNTGQPRVLADQGCKEITLIGQTVNSYKHTSGGQTKRLSDLLYALHEIDGIRMCRDVVAHLNWRKLGPGPTLPADPPLHDPDDLLGIVAKDLRQPFDMREVIARIVDGSRFEEFKPLYGPTLVTG